MPKYNDFDLDLQKVEFDDNLPMEQVGSDDVTSCTSGVYTDIRSAICFY